jgi:hypothetical protein
VRRAFRFAALTYIAAAAAAPTRAADYVRVQFLPSKEPALFLQFDGDTLRIATAPEGLATAEPVKADYATPARPEGRLRVVYFSNVALPLRSPGANGTTASFRVISFPLDERVPKARLHLISGSFPISITSRGGVAWTYVPLAYVEAPQDAAAASLQNAPVMVIGDLSHPALMIVPHARGPVVSIYMKLWTAAPGRAKGSGGREVSVPAGAANEVESLRKDGKPARAHLDVIAPSGKTIRSEDGDLGAFGIGPRGPNYAVRVAEKGSYIVRASVQTPNGPLAAETKFVVE